MIICALGLLDKTGKNIRFTGQNPFLRQTCKYIFFIKLKSYTSNTLKPHTCSLQTASDNLYFKKTT